MGQFLLNGSLAPCKKTGKFLQAVLQKNYRQIDEPTKEPRKFHRTLSQQADFEMNRLYLQDRLI